MRRTGEIEQLDDLRLSRVDRLELGFYLEKAEIEGLLGRWKRIREILERKISASSEAAVLFDYL